MINIRRQTTYVPYRIYPKAYFPALYIAGLLNSNQLGHAVGYFKSIQDRREQAFVYGYVSGWLRHTIESKIKLRQFKYLVKQNPV